ncbi:molybdenum cofactor biosynthesis protein MoaE [Propioniciclava tarda]|uniref:Molybdenum cofactor biosynthesis protein MoaE n=1 Tax=Propioniciclava tarda TaxID=433330 RepID=A0A4Q9KI38_PROTD|nr:molybdenum cofactor biosynthesis protein MoaE [Propioniciclava tarda]TBT93053.1 molybdenum cofactor biosynthesis protein MoaE [Propioniciclava tarda]SMO79689.1 molybdopterin synthase subunit MoaE [Propioniciclava tarda]
MPVLEAFVTDQPIDSDRMLLAVESPAVGAVASFYGVIRNHDPEASGEVVSLDYTCHPDAGRIIREIADSVVTQLDPEGEALVVVGHRIGRLVVGDAALVAHVATGHRGLAFTVCQELVERIKAELPIWKHQQEASGRTVWSNLGLDADG